MTPSKWLQRLNVDEEILAEVYGHDSALRHMALRLWQDTLQRFVDRFGERDVRLFRSPGRINLRGMHVDTHGGYLNLMTHQRETVVVAALADDHSTAAVNTEADFPEVTFSAHGLSEDAAFRMLWNDFIVAPAVRRRVSANTGSWGNYIAGCALNVQHRFPDCAIPALYLAVGSSLPRGAALSSSAALCTSVVLAFSQWAGCALTPEELILAARDAEWFAGSRCGVSDQAAMVLGAPGQCVNVALHPARFDISAARTYAFPEETDVLVIDSQTERSLSGKQLIDYTRNRFAYSIALHVCRQELATLGVSAERLAKVDSLPALAPCAWEDRDGLALVYRILMRIPETIELDTLRERYDVPELDALYLEHFGNVPESERPRSFRLRGPLLFGIAESERARLFPGAVQRGEWQRAGQLMSLGHDGDRRVQPNGSPYVFDASDHVLTHLEASRVPVENCPGAYGASTPALDFLVDSALDAGAHGASLTGAGLAGSVLALCPRDASEGIASHVRDTLRSLEYAGIAGVPEPFSAEIAEKSVLSNRAIAGAGEIRS